MHCHMQRMGGLNALVLLRDQQHSVSVGQEKRIVVWNMSNNDPVFSRNIDDENDEGNAIAVYEVDSTFPVVLLLLFFFCESK